MGMDWVVKSVGESGLGPAQLDSTRTRIHKIVAISGVLRMKENLVRLTS